MEETTEFKDKKGLLTLLGVVEIIGGGFLFLLSILALVSSLALRTRAGVENYQVSLSSVFTASLMYIAGAAIFITLGIGSIRTRRWARSLSLLLSWFTLILGIFSIVMLILMMPELTAHMNRAGGDNAVADAAIISFVQILIVILVGLFLIILPGLFILAYRSPDVIKTVQKYDTKERWTDKVPLPVLGLSIIFAYAAISPLLSFSYIWIIPFFGSFLTGWPAAAIWGINSVILIYLAINIYRLKLRAWYYSLGLYCFWVISFVISLLSKDFFDIYKYMNIPDQQIEMMKRIGFTNSAFLIMLLVFSLLYLIFLIYIKRYFDKLSYTKFE